MVYFPNEILTLILDYTDDRLEKKQKQLHHKTCEELIERFKIDDDIDYQFFLYSLFNYYTDIAGNVCHYDYDLLSTPIGLEYF